MEIIIKENHESCSEVAANILAKLLKEKPNAALGFATGSSPLGLYKNLIDLYNKKIINFKNVTSFNLDEYVGLDTKHPASYTSFMHKNLFDHINIEKKNINIPNGMSSDIPNECKNYEDKIRKVGGIDLQILGLGRDGHIAFNEPISSLASKTRIKTLTKQTKRDNAKNFEGDILKVPNHVITMGISSIMECKQIVLLAFGESKADAIASAVEGPISSMVPASILQMHPKVHIIIDEKAASKLTKEQYYRWVYDNKPDWQKYF